MSQIATKFSFRHKFLRRNFLSVVNFVANCDGFYSLANSLAILVFSSSDTKLHSTLSTFQAQENFHIITYCLSPTNGSSIGFLGCDSYLKSLIPKISLIHLKSLHVSIFGWDTAICLSYLQAHS